MVKARFYISNKLAVQDVGLRVIAVSTMMEMQFKNGTAINLPDGRVEVLVEGKEEKIKKLQNKILERLKLQLKELGYEEQMQETKNPTCSEITFGIDEDIPKLMESSQQLVLDQIGKGVIYLRKLETLPKDIADALAKIIKK